MQAILDLMSLLLERLRALLRLPSLPAGDLLHDRNYRRIFASVVITHFGAQITMLALPLTAVTVLNASDVVVFAVAAPTVVEEPTPAAEAAPAGEGAAPAAPAAGGDEGKEGKGKG